MSLAIAESLVTKQSRELIFSQGFWGSLLLHLKRVYTSAVRTMATDGIHLFVNPDFVPRLTIGGLRTVLAHEVAHCALRHFDRMADRDPKIWNRATDYRINYDLRAAGFEAPRWINEDGTESTWLYDADYAKLTAEQIYDRELAKERAKQAQAPQAPQAPQNGQGGSGKGSQGSQAGSQPGKGSQGSQAPQGSQGSGKGSGQGSAKGSQGSSSGQGSGKGSQTGSGAPQAGKGSGQGSEPGSSSEPAGQGSGELPDGIGDDMGLGGILPCPVTDPAAMADLAAQWQVRVRQAAKQASKAGKLPGFARDLIDALNRPKIDWKEKLRSFVGEAIAQDQSWNRPNKRFAWQGLILPSFPRDAIERILFLADTSMSMAKPELTAAFSEAQAILDEGGCNILQWACVDTRVASHGELFAGDTFEGFKASGGGGTNFASAMRWANQQDAQLIIWFTDGDTADWGEAPACPVIVLGAKRWEAKIAQCPYGEAIGIEL